MLNSYSRRITSLETFLYTLSTLQEFKAINKNPVRKEELINMIINKIRRDETENNVFFINLPTNVNIYVNRILKKMKEARILRIFRGSIYINFLELEAFLRKYECLNSLLQYSPIEVFANLKDLICKYSNCSDIKSSLRYFYYNCGLSFFVSPVRLYSLLNERSEKDLKDEKIHKELNPDCLVIYAIYQLANEGKGNVISLTYKKIIELLEEKIFLRELKPDYRRILKRSSRKILSEFSNEIEKSTIISKNIYIYNRESLLKHIKENYIYSQCLKKYKPIS